ncbi:MAG: type II secretion system F family protein [Candidatus Riflebacteria bacterium]|nr:type II secretion system F family protein [Candidatus Riflebacteria bacterium]
MLPILLGVGAAVVVTVLVLFGKDDDQEVKDRMAQFASLDAAGEGGAPGEAHEAKVENKAQEILQTLGSIAKPFTPDALNHRFGKMIEKAAVKWRPNEFAALVYIAFIVSGAFGYFYAGMLVAVLFAAVGACLPFAWLHICFKRRMSQIGNQMLDTLILLSNAIKAGYSLLQAMDMISKESPPPMGEEFKRIIREVAFGVPVEEALLAFKERIPSEDLDLMVTVVLIQRQIGGNLSEILDKIAHTIRERIRIRGQIATLTAQGKISGAIIAGMPVALIGVLRYINPGYISLLWAYSPKDGSWHSWYILVVCGIMEIIGFMVIMKIVNIEV